MIEIDEIKKLNIDVNSIYETIVKFDEEFIEKTKHSDPQERYFSYVSIEKAAILEDKIKLLNNDDKKLLLDKVINHIYNECNGVCTSVFSFVYASIIYLMNNKTK